MVEIKGIVEEVIFENEINGYTVCDIRYEQELITAVGYMPFINVGETLKLNGKWVNHPDYGMQLKVEMYEKILPQTRDAIERYLASGVVKGVGPSTAKKIVDKFGKDTLDIIQFNPDELSVIKGISHEKALKIGQAFDEQKEIREVVMFFQQYGISPAYSIKIFKEFGDKTIEIIKSNPYRLANEIFGIGFKTSDRIAMNMGIDPLSKYRICSGIKYVLSRAASSGHTFMPDDKLKEYTSQLLEVNVQDINNALVSLTLDKSVFVENDGDIRKVFLSSFYNAEFYVCKKLIELSDIRFAGDLSDLDSKLKQVEKEEDIILADMQKTAVKEALQNGVLIITGGPGTGKTTIIKTIIKLLDMEGYDVSLAAPTGRAAKRMSEATGYEAKTIHRLLEIGYTSSDSELIFQRTEANPLEVDVIVIDEMSMVDILLMNHLLKAVMAGTRLILVGDVNQLPSVGAGNVLKDLIESSFLKTVKLTEIFRQAEESMIVVNAHKINRGENPHLNVKDKDFFFVARSNANSIIQTVVQLCYRRLPESYKYDPLRHIQVLTPTRKGMLGVTNLNIELQKALNPAGDRKEEMLCKEFTFREGDKVMQIKNNYKLRWEKTTGKTVEGIGVFNGDTGIIQKIDNESEKLTILFDDERTVEYSFSMLDEVEPAFAVTIHKSQGSEFPVVVMPVFSGPEILLTRNLLYTAVTRAKELVILVGQEGILYNMVNNKREMLRYSGLADKITKYLKGIKESKLLRNDEIITPDFYQGV